MTTTTPHPQMHVPSNPNPRALALSEQQLLGLHHALHPELYDDRHEFHEWTDDTLDVIAVAIEQAYGQIRGTPHARRLTQAEQHISDLHYALHPELYDEDHEFHERTTETLEVIADAVRRACRDLELPGFIDERHA